MGSCVGVFMGATSACNPLNAVWHMKSQRLSRQELLTKVCDAFV